MLSAADGKDTASIMAVAENISAIQRSIESQLAAPDASVELLQTYTGIYMMCNKVYVYALQQAFAAIDSRYLGRLEKIRNEASRLQEHARSLLSGAEETDRKILEVNITANQRTRWMPWTSTTSSWRARRSICSSCCNGRKNPSRWPSTPTGRSRPAATCWDDAYVGSDFSRIFAFQPPDLSLAV